MKQKADYLFEASWEVCNKVGGIYTVVKSKSSAMQKAYDNYFLVGPYFQDKADAAFEEEEPPEFLAKAFKSMEEKGIKCHYGTWLVEENPKTILIEYMDADINMDDTKSWLWENYKVDSINASWDFNPPMQWGWCVGMLMHQLCGILKDKNTILHAHEWLSGAPILYLNKNCPNIKTVFTTHATMLGRTICGSGGNLYEMLDTIDPEKEAKKHNIMAKYTMEKACAHTADCFTTVSEITAIEAEKLLGKKVDVVLNNGLNVKNFPTLEETTLMHVKNRDIVREFLAYFFFPYYSFEPEHNLIYYVLGRFEHKNKGLDLIIDAAKKLNDKLKEEKFERTISLFFFIPMSNKGIKQDVLENKRYYTHIKTTLDRHEDEIMQKLVYDVVSKKCSMEESIFTSKYMDELKGDLRHFHREGTPPISTHEITDRESNPVVNGLEEAGLDNKQDDPVKVIIYPVYLDGNDNLLNLPYYEALAAGHLGLFPSYYEPWGYTPVEAMSMGVPSVTSDLAGFGRFMKPKLLDKNPGVFVLERMEPSREEQVEELYDIMLKFANYDHSERVQNKINAKSMSYLSDWDHFVKNYVKAHNKALE